jgi:hypothetical protein
MDVHDLIKIESQTSDWRVARMLERVGFETEGVRFDSFRFKGRLLDRHMMALRRF